MTIPQSLGGQGRSFLDAVLVIEEMAKCCTVTARIVVETNMGAISTVMAYGSEEQKKLAAALVLAGDKPAICITEPDAGSDTTAMTTRAERRGDRYILNGRKHWITGAGVSRLHLIFARVFDERGQDLGIGGFLAVRGNERAKGLRVVRREKTMGLRGMPEGELVFEDLELPATMAVLPPSGLRRGFADLMTAYNSQRVGAGTVALGIAAGALELALDWVRPRAVRPPDRRIPGPAMDARRHADPAHRVAADALYGGTLAWRGIGFPDPMLAAQAKVFASEAAIRIVNDALQMFGARGYSRELPLERMARDVRMFTIGGGTAQVLRTLVAARMLGWKLPQTRDGYVEVTARPLAAE